MGRIKETLLQQQEEDQEVFMCYLEWVEENREVFSQLGTPTPEEVIGYEE